MPDWSRIVHQFGPVVWSTARRLTGNDADAADSFQETFVSALDLSRRQEIWNWRGLLKRLATSRSLDCLRRRHRHRARVHDEVECSTLIDPLTPPSRAVEQNEFAAHLRAALAELPKQQAEVFCLRHFEDLSYEEISQQLEITVNYVGVQLNRAKSALRQKLSAHSAAAANERK